MGQPNKQETFSNVQPIGQQETFSNVTPIDPSQPPRGFLSGLYDSVAGPVKALASSFTDKPTDGTLFDKTLDAQTAEGGKAVENAKQGRYSEAAGHGLAAVVPGFGPAAAKAGEDIGAGKTGYGLGEASGVLAQAMAPAAARNSGKIAQSIGAVAKPLGVAAEDLPVVGSVVKGAKALKNVSGEISDIWAKKPTYPGAPLPESPGYNPGAPLPEHPGTFPGAPNPEVPDPDLLRARSLFEGSTSPSDPAAALRSVKSGAIAQAMKDPGAPLPEAPDPQLLQARSLFNGSTSPADPAAGLGTIKQPGQAGQLAEAMQKQPAEVAPGFNRGQLGNLLDQSLGAKKLEPKVPLRQQMPATASPKPAAATSGADVPEGHTPVTSSALRSYKYDPAAREFHARMTSGDTGYVYGDVSPEDVQAFENSDSKGQAFQQIKRNALVAKIVNGKRLPVKAAAQ